MVITRQIRTTLDVLAAQGGELRDPGGGATIVLADLLARAGYEVSPLALTNNLIKWEKRGLIGREVRGKRTYAIRLGPEAPAEFHQRAADVASLPQALTRPEPEPEPLIGEPEAMARSAASAATMADALDYDRLAESLLRVVVGHLQAGSAPAPSADDEVVMLRRKVAELEEKLRVHQAERVRATQELDLLTAEIRKLLGGSSHGQAASPTRSDEPVDVR